MPPLGLKHQALTILLLPMISYLLTDNEAPVESLCQNFGWIFPNRCLYQEAVCSVALPAILGQLSEGDRRLES